MITTKQRAVLRGLANTLRPIMQLGKDGVTDNVLQQVKDYLYHKELIKIKVLPASEQGAKEIINELCKSVAAEPVQAIGNTIVIYKRSTKKGIENIVF